jgi:glyceraldehyde 3-phosphate dehydrogenase
MLQKIRVAINGFGRVGRAAFKIALQKEDLEVVAINDLTDNKTLAHLLQYDSVFGKFSPKVRATSDSLLIGDKKYPATAVKEPEKLPWKKYKVDVVLECTGKFRKYEDAKMHLEAGAGKVILSAPGKDKKIKTYVLGVNEKDYQGEKIINNASCTTNCIAPIMKVMSKKFGVLKALMTTVHSYTADQNLIDGPHKDLRRARAAAYNIVPTSTGAATATAETLPELNKIFDGLAIRVPTINVSLADITLVTKKRTTIGKVNQAFKEAAKSKELKGILTVTNEPLVSSDFIASPASTIIDLSLTNVVGQDLVKVIAWYDNEWGYANRLVEIVSLVMTK